MRIASANPRRARKLFEFFGFTAEKVAEAAR
jgi:hypothetical protein